MIVDDKFRAALFIVKLRGRELATILVGNFPRTGSTAGIHTLDGIKDMINPSNQTDVTIAVGNNGLKYTYESSGESRGQNDIFMVTIGALYQAAGETSHGFVHFVSIFPGYKTIVIWDSAIHPSRFTFNMLIGAILGSAKYVVAKNDYRELKGRVEVDGTLVASGGWFAIPLPDVPSS